jgi:hypothetical protein
MQRRQSRVSVVSDTTGGETLERFGSRPPTVVCAVSFTVTLSRQELIKMKQLIDGGVQPIVSAVFPLEARQAFQRRFGGHTSERICVSRRALSLAEANSRVDAASLISRRRPIRRQPQAHILNSVPEGFWGRDATNVTPRRW